MTFILVILTVAFFASIEFLRRSHRSSPNRNAELIMEHPSPIEVTDRFFHPAHTWVLVPAGKREVTVGADDFSEGIVGRLTSIGLPDVGQTIKQGEPYAHLHHGNRVLSQASPVAGTVVEVNPKLKKYPELLNESPLDRGWIARIDPANLAGDLSNLLSGATADAWRRGVQTRLIQHWSPALGTVLQDGGELVKDFADHLNDVDWNLLVHEFFPTVSIHPPQINTMNQGAKP